MRFNIVRPVARSFSGVCADPNEPIAKPVRIPLYMICLDLAFTAAFNVCAGCLRLSKHDDGDPITRFWASYLPIAWIWDHTNRYFNRFDQNDLISELVVLTLMGGVMAYTLNTKTCFYADELPEAPISAPPPPPAWLLHEGTARQLQWQLDGTVHAPGPGTPLDGSSCFYLAAAFGGCRALTTALTAYVALFKVTLAKRLLWRELALWLLLAPLLAQVASPVDMPYLESAYLELVLLLGCLIDMLISLAGELPKQLRCGVDRNEARLASDAGLDSRYTIMRNERMLIIMLGNVCVTATQGAFSQVRTFGWRDAAACMATPWAAFLLKTWYFELCQIETARDGTVAANAGLHATQRSGMAATLWSLVHMPLIGCILWISVSITKMLAATEESAANIPHGYNWLCAGFVTFIGLGTFQQCLHSGSGRGSRRCGKRKRILIRAVGISVLIAGQVPLMWLPPSESSAMLTLLVDLVWLTLLAGIELGGLRFKHRPGSESTTTGTLDRSISAPLMYLDGCENRPVATSV